MLKTLKSKNSGRIIVLSMLVLLLVFASNLMSGYLGGPNTSPSDVNLGCSDLSNCSGLASCGEAGDPNGCELTCKGGARINCPGIN